jgi:hypothetical protein
MTVSAHARVAPAPAPALDSLVHPVPLTALAVLLVNDHVLKPLHPGWLSGKLSDFAVMVLLPFLLLAAWDVVRIVRPAFPPAGPRMAVAGVVVSIVVFTAIELSPLGAELYRWGLGGAQWPFRALAALITSQPLPRLAPVALTSDVSDLLALPAALAVLPVRPWLRRAV